MTKVSRTFSIDEDLFFSLKELCKEKKNMSAAVEEAIRQYVAMEQSKEAST